MPDELSDGLVGLDQITRHKPYLRSTANLPPQVIFKTRSQWRKHTRQQADSIPFDQHQQCRVEIEERSYACDAADLHIIGDVDEEDFNWLTPSTQLSCAWRRDGWRSDFHLELLPMQNVEGYMLRLSRRFYPPHAATSEGQDIGELGHLFLRVTPASFSAFVYFNEQPPSIQRHPGTLPRLLKEVNELVLRLSGAMFHVSGIFYNGRLTTTRTPRDFQRRLQHEAAMSHCAAEVLEESTDPR